MRRPIVFAAALPLLLAIAARGEPRNRAGQMPPGAQLFKSKGCAACHGGAGQGGVGPALRPDPPGTPGFIAYVRAPAGVMPPYATLILSDADATTIRIWLANLPPPRDPATLPDLLPRHSASAAPHRDSPGD